MSSGSNPIGLKTYTAANSITNEFPKAAASTYIRRTVNGCQKLWG